MGKASLWILEVRERKQSCCGCGAKKLLNGTKTEGIQLQRTHHRRSERSCFEHMGSKTVTHDEGSPIRRTLSGWTSPVAEAL